MADFSLELFAPVLEGSDRLLTGLGSPGGWKRSIRDKGGFWQASLPLDGSLADLTNAYYTWLGGHLLEKSAGDTTWEGMVYELELVHHGTRRRRTLDTMYNAVEVVYSADGEVTTTGYSTQAQSIARYGRRETQLSMDNVPVATAQGMRSTYLARHAWPWPRPMSISLDGETRLEILVAGYVFTANWMYAQAADDSEGNVEAWIEDLVGTAEGLSSDHGGSVSGAGDCQFLSTGNLATNTLQVTREIPSEIRTWSLIEDLVELGDSGGDPWRAWVDAGRELHYQEIDLAPRYYLRGGDLYDIMEFNTQISPWKVRPGVVRDLTYPVSRAERGSMLDDARDLYVSEVEVSASGGLSLKAGELDEVEIISAQAAMSEGV
jgi:hypothetical protein